MPFSNREAVDARSFLIECFPDIGDGVLSPWVEREVVEKKLRPLHALACYYAIQRIANSNPFMRGRVVPRVNSPEDKAFRREIYQQITKGFPMKLYEADHREEDELELDVEIAGGDMNDFWQHYPCFTTIQQGDMVNWPKIKKLIRPHCEIHCRWLCGFISAKEADRRLEKLDEKFHALMPVDRAIWDEIRRRHEEKNA